MVFTWYWRSSEPIWFFDLKTDLADIVEAIAATRRANGIDRGASN